MTPLRLRAAVRDLDAYRPGRRAQASQSQVARLASNERPDPTDSRVLAAAHDALTSAHRYPDPHALGLVTALAERYSVPAANLVVGCGSVQLLQELVATTCDAGDEVVFPWRSFEAYPTLARIAGAAPRPVALRHGHIDLSAILDAVTPRTRLVLLCSPNNPVGPALSHAHVHELLTQLPQDVVVALDEAYAEYVTDPRAVRGLDLIGQHANLTVLRTFSKAYGLAALRVGFAVCADPALADAIRKVHLPFSVSTPAQAAAVASLAIEDEVMRQVARSVSERERVLGALRDMGWAVPDAQGNFLWVAVGAASATLARRFDEAGVLTRCFENEGVRITVGTEEENARVIDVLRRSPDLQQSADVADEAVSTLGLHTLS